MNLAYNFQLTSRTGPRKVYLLVLVRSPRAPFREFIWKFYETQSRFAHPRMQPKHEDVYVYVVRNEFTLEAHNFGRFGILTLNNHIESGQNSGVFVDYHYYTFDAVFTGRSMS